jgi:hypothetical protein
LEELAVGTKQRVVVVLVVRVQLLWLEEQELLVKVVQEAMVPIADQEFLPLAVQAVAARLPKAPMQCVVQVQQVVGEVERQCQ